MAIWAPVFPSQSRTVLSPDAEASLMPSAENTTELMELKCPSRVLMCVPVFPSHSRTVLSVDAEASLEPSSEKVTELTELECPSSVAI